MSGPSIDETLDHDACSVKFNAIRHCHINHGMDHEPRNLRELAKVVQECQAFQVAVIKTPLNCQPNTM